MAKAAKKSKPSKTKKKAKPKTAAEPIPAKQLRFKAPPALIKKLRQFERSAQTYWAAQPKISAEDRAALDHHLAIRDGLVPPPWMKRQRQRQRAKQQVDFAKELLEIAYPKGEWRTMKTGAIRHGCALAAKAKGKPLPSRDSFARATGRR
jgi:hypothetical protein